jgi:hypothetical protein
MHANRKRKLQGLFWLVFSTLGMHVFGGLALDEANAYPNYDSFLNSLVSSFNVLNLENWNQQMYAVTRASNAGAIAYYLVRDMQKQSVYFYCCCYCYCYYNSGLNLI